MPLAWSETRGPLAFAFLREYADIVRDNADSRSLWNALFHVSWLNRWRVATFVRSTDKLVGRAGASTAPGRAR